MWHITLGQILCNAPTNVAGGNFAERLYRLRLEIARVTKGEAPPVVRGYAIEVEAKTFIKAVEAARTSTPHAVLGLYTTTTWSMVTKGDGGQRVYISRGRRQDTPRSASGNRRGGGVCRVEVGFGRISLATPAGRWAEAHSTPGGARCEPSFGTINLALCHSRTPIFRRVFLYSRGRRDLELIPQLDPRTAA